MRRFRKPAVLAVMIAVLMVGALAISCGGSSPAAPPPPPPPPPNIPAAITVTSGQANQLTLSWEAVANAVEYEIRFHTGVNVDYAGVGYQFVDETTAVITELAAETLYSVWIRAVFGENNYGPWARRAVGATYPFTQAFDVIVVGAGGAGGAATIAARSVGFEDRVNTTFGEVGIMADPTAWNDLNILLLEQRQIWGGNTNTAGSGNAIPGNANMAVAYQETFEQFRTRWFSFIRGAGGTSLGWDAPIPGTNRPTTIIESDPLRHNFVPVSQHYPNWGIMYVVFRQKIDVNHWLRLRGGPVSQGDISMNNTMFNRIQNYGIAEIRLQTKATGLIYSGTPGTDAVVTGVVATELTGGHPGWSVRGLDSVLGNPGASQRIAARKVILTTGGFQGLTAEAVQSADWWSRIHTDRRNPIATEFMVNARVNNYGSGLDLAYGVGAAFMGNYATLAGMLGAAGGHLAGLNIPAGTASLPGLPSDTAFPGGNWGAFFYHPGRLQGLPGGITRAAQIVVGNDGLRFQPEEFGTWSAFDMQTNVSTHRMALSGEPNRWPIWLIFSGQHLDDVITPWAHVDAPHLAGPAVPASGYFEGGWTRRAVLERVYAHVAASGTEVQRREIFRGNTLAELASVAGINSANLIAEVRAYDYAVRAAMTGYAANGNWDAWEDPLTDGFHPNRRPDAPGTGPGTGPFAKTASAANMVRFLTDADQNADNDPGTNSGPFFAVRFTPAAWDSGGGVLTDVWGRVIRHGAFPAGGFPHGGAPGGNLPTAALSFDQLSVPAGDIIRNLYAAGAVTNRHFLSYTYHPSLAISTGVAHGILAARHAGRSIMDLPHTFDNVIPGLPAGIETPAE